MTLVLDLFPLAERDITEHAAYLDDHSPGAGSDFLNALAHIFERLVSFPAFGQATPSDVHPDLRRVVIRPFNVSVFYEATPTTINVVRVLHHARHVPPLLDEL